MNWNALLNAAETRLRDVLMPGGRHGARGVASINCHEDGVVRAGDVDIARYAPNKPLHIKYVISVPEKNAKIVVNGESSRSVVIPWEKPSAAAFKAVTFEGLLPGSFAEAPSAIAFDNIRLLMEKYSSPSALSSAFPYQTQHLHEIPPPQNNPCTTVHSLRNPSPSVYSSCL